MSNTRLAVSAETDQNRALSSAFCNSSGKHDIENGLAKLLTKKEVAELLSVSVRTIEMEVEDGKLFPVRIRSSIRFTPDVVHGYIQQATRGLVPKREVSDYGNRDK